MVTEQYKTVLANLKANVISEILNNPSDLLENLKQENNIEDEWELTELIQTLPIIEVRNSITGNVKDFYFVAVTKEGGITLIDIEEETKNTSYSLSDIDAEQLIIILDSL